ncbi:hypothetical protein [Escherichia coli]|nr:hypothetical protein [Escherichia coli]
MTALTPSLSTQTTVSASSCKVEFRHGNMTLENPSPELLTVLIRRVGSLAAAACHGLKLPL